MRRVLLAEAQTDELKAPESALSTVPDEPKSKESPRPSPVSEPEKIHAEAIELTKAARLRAAG